MSIVERSNCKISTLNNRGLGSCEFKGRELNFPYVLPDETIEFTHYNYRGKDNFVVDKVLSYSSSRNTPPCKYFGACGGCLLQHLNHDSYLEFKYSVIRNALKDYKIDSYLFSELKNNQDDRILIKEILSIKVNARRRAVFEVVKKEDKVFIGFHRYKSHQIINIESCLVLDPKLSNLLEPLHKLCFAVLADKQKATLFFTKADNGIDFIFEIKGQEKIDIEQKNILQAFAHKHSIIRLIYRYKSKWDVVHQTERPWIKFDEVAVEIDSHSFLQVSSWSDEIIAKLVLDAITEQYGNIDISVADLFCGRGTISIPLAKKYKVDAFELEKPSLKALEVALKKADGRIVACYCRDLFSTPLSWGELNRYDVVAINPPRIGAKEQCLAMQNSSVKMICYVSCNPDSFARDAAILLAGHYKLLYIQPIDQFYWSPHTELFGVFIR